MRKAGFKVRRASPGNWLLASPNMDRIIVVNDVIGIRVWYQCEVRLALRVAVWESTLIALRLRAVASSRGEFDAERRRRKDAKRPGIYRA